MMSIFELDKWSEHYQIVCRLACFILLFCLLAGWEQWRSWRPRIVSRHIRWLRHLSLSTLSKLAIRLVYPVFAVTFALSVEQRGVGLLHHENWPYVLRVLLGVIGLDLIWYLQHRLFHKYKWLWRIHRVHHLDKELDVSTGLRFHPLEEMISMGVKLLAIAFLGALPLSVLIFEVLLNAFVMFAHMNVQFKFSTEMALRRFIITPGMHRLHHSDNPPETNSNYGFILSCWDHFFDSYTLIAQAGERKLVFGLEEFRSNIFQTFSNLLQLPFNPKHLKIKRLKKSHLRFKED